MHTHIHTHTHTVVENYICAFIAHKALTLRSYVYLFNALQKSVKLRIPLRLLQIAQIHFAPRHGFIVQLDQLRKEATRAVT
jgi:hypothetical protein